MHETGRTIRAAGVLSPDLALGVLIHLSLSWSAIALTLMGGISAVPLLLMLHPVIIFAELCGMLSPLNSQRHITHSKPSMDPDLILVPLPFVYAFVLLCVSLVILVTDVTLSTALVAGAALGLSGGILTTAAAHELIHSDRKWVRLIGRSHFWSILYPHFPVLHCDVHHRFYGTARDPQSARPGEPIARYLCRVSVQSWSWYFRHDVKTATLYLCATFVLFSFIMLLSPPLALFLLAAALSAGTILEAINYIQHLPLSHHGWAEKQTLWQSKNPITRALLFNLGAHAAHHQDRQASWASDSFIDSHPESTNWGYWCLLLGMGLYFPARFFIAGKERN